MSGRDRDRPEGPPDVGRAEPGGIDPALGRWFRDLRAEAAEPAPPASMAAAVLARLDHADPHAQDDAAWWAPDDEPLLGERFVGERLRDEVRDEVAARDADGWAAMASAVSERLLAASADPQTSAELEEAIDPLAPDGLALDPLFDRLRAERVEALAGMEGRWSAFRHQILHRLERPLASDLEARAVDLLRADVEAEVDALAPAFEGRFESGIDRRIAPRSRERTRWPAWLRPRATWPLGLAAAAAVALLFVRIGPGPGPGEAPSPELRASRPARVEVDSIAFEGDMMMIPDDEVTMVILSDA